MYDSLIPFEALSQAKEGCKKIFVGKVSSKNTKARTTQAKINQLLLQEYTRLKEDRNSSSKNSSSALLSSGIIVRLKGGDPSIFGRLVEEVKFAQKNQIPFSIVPGVSSFYSVPINAGIPLTARGLARSFSVITGHLKDSKELKIIIDSDTVVYLMGIKNLSKIVKYNLSLGKAGSTPVAIIMDGTTDKERVVVGKLENIIALAEKAKVTHPGIVVVGEVVKLRDVFLPKKDKLNKLNPTSFPLQGKKVVLLKSLFQLEELANLVKNKGGKTYHYPLLTFEKVHSEENNLINTITKKNKKQNKVILFSSKNAVDRFMEVLKNKLVDLRFLANYKILCVGEKTSDHLLKYGFKADLLPDASNQEGSNQEGLWKVIERHGIRHIIHPRSEVARDYLEKKMHSSKRDYHSFTLYRYREKILSEEEILEILKMGLVVLTSPLMVRTFAKSLKLFSSGKLDKTKWHIPPTLFFSLGEITHQEVKHRFFGPFLRSCFYIKKSSYENLVKKIVTVTKKLSE